MNDEKRACISEQVEKVKRQLDAAVKLTAALAESMADPIDWTLADLFGAEYIAESLRRTLSSPGVKRTIRNLTDTAILDAGAMRAIDAIENNQ